MKNPPLDGGSLAAAAGWYQRPPDRSGGAGLGAGPATKGAVGGPGCLAGDPPSRSNSNGAARRRDEVVPTRGLYPPVPFAGGGRQNGAARDPFVVIGKHS